MNIKLIDTYVKYVCSGTFRYTFKFERAGSSLVVTSLTIADVKEGDSPSDVANKLRAMAEKLEEML